MSGVVQQSKKERERAQKQVQRIDEAHVALGIRSNGASRTMSVPLVEGSAWRRRCDGRSSEQPRRSGLYQRQEEADRGGTESTVSEEGA
jgi:hypothetical protein